MKTILRGTERTTLEIEGRIEGAIDGIDAPFETDGTVSLLLFSMRRLAFRALPWVGMSYHEGLWRIGIRVDGSPAWLAVRCDLDSAIVRALGRRIVRYPAKAASFEVARDGWTLHATEGALSVRFEASDDTPAPEPPRRTFVMSEGRAFVIPWEEIAAPSRASARVEVLLDTLSVPTLGSRVSWSSQGLAHRGRIHMCGVARPMHLDRS